MKLAINGQQLGATHSLSEILDIVRSFSVDAVEIWPHNLPGGDDEEERQRYEQKDVVGAQQIIQSHNMKVACVTLGFNAMSVCMGIGGVGRTTEAIQGAVDAATTLGANMVNCYLAGVPPQLFVEAMKPAATYAGERGVTIVLENEAHDESATPERVRWIVEQVASPHFGTEYDPCNYYHAYEEPYPKAYEILKRHIRYVHLKGGIYYEGQWCETRGSLMRGQADRHIGYVPLPESAFNVDSILRRLAQDGYQGYITLEPHVPVEKALGFYQSEVPFVRARLSAERSSVLT